MAEQLSKSKNTSVAGMVDAGIAASKGGKVRLLRPDELPEDWDPSADSRLTAYRLYTLCERKKRAVDALAYNGLVQSWPEIVRLAREDLFDEDAE